MLTLWPRHLRKTPLLLLLLLLLLFVQKLFFVSLSDKKNEGEDPGDPAEKRYVICRNIVDGNPFGESYDFQSRQRRVYFYTRPESPLPGNGIHIWYHGADTVKVTSCLAGERHCISSLNPDKLARGDWSVDFIIGRSLVASRQFSVH